MSDRLCCYNQQEHSKLLAQFVFKVSAFRFNTRTKTCAPMPDCRINNALIHVVPSCQLRIRERRSSTSLFRPLTTLHAALSCASS